MLKVSVFYTQDGQFAFTFSSEYQMQKYYLEMNPGTAMRVINSQKDFLEQFYTDFQEETVRNVEQSVMNMKKKKQKATNFFEAIQQQAQLDTSQTPTKGAKRKKSKGAEPTKFEPDAASSAIDRLLNEAHLQKKQDPKKRSAIQFMLMYGDIAQEI